MNKRATKKKFFSSFAFLNLTQFATALNDNLYKLLLVFFLITEKGVEHSNTILALAGGIFVIPFLLFASTAGTLADRYSKRTIIYFTRLIEILTTLLVVLVFYFHWVIGGYVVLFLMATLSTLFSPCKFGIIPEIVAKERTSHCNGILTATTYLAIILGTFLASFLTDITRKNFVLAGSFTILIACIGWLASNGIEKTEPQAATKRVSARFITVIIRTLREANKRRYLLTTIVFGAYFLFMGSYTQLNIIPFALHSLHFSEVQGGYLFLMTAIGIGLGSFLAGQLSGKEVELGFVPLAAFGVGICLIGLYLFDAHFFVVVPLLMLLGAFGGFYIVPVDTFIQIASPDANRGQNVAAANFLNFLGVVVAAGLLALLGNVLGFSAAQGFLTVGLLTILLGMTLLLLYADQVLRLIVATASKIFCHIKVKGKKRVQLSPPMLLVAPCTSWLDTLMIMATLPRLIRYIVPIRNGEHKHSLLYKLLWIIPIDIEHFSPIGPPALEAIRKELEGGHSVCLMHPVDFPSKTLKEWEERLEKLLKDIHVPIMPIHISRKVKVGASRWEQLKEVARSPIYVSYGLKR